MERLDPRPDDSTEDALPERLASELRALWGRPTPVPPAIDRLVLARAEGALLPASPRRVPLPRWWWPRPAGRPRWASVVGVAAAVVLGMLLGRLVFLEDLPGDVDQSGRVDILDAFALARRLERGERVESRCDLTGDGAVDLADVEAVARRAVSLERGGGS